MRSNNMNLDNNDIYELIKLFSKYRDDNPIIYDYWKNRLSACIDPLESSEFSQLLCNLEYEWRQIPGSPLLSKTKEATMLKKWVRKNAEAIYNHEITKRP